MVSKILFVIFLSIHLIVCECKLVRKLTCPVFIAQGTNSVRSKYCTCNVNVCSNDIISISLLPDFCNSTSNQPMIRIYKSDEPQELFSGSPDTSCSILSKLSMASTFSECGTLAIRQGCVDDTSCKGSLQLLIESTPVNNLRREDIVISTMVSLFDISEQASVSSTTGTSSCQYVASQKHLKKKSKAISVSSVIIYCLVFGVAFLCCCGRLAMCHDRIKKCFGKRENGRLYSSVVPAIPIVGNVVDIRSSFPEATVAISNSLKETDVEVIVSVCSDSAVEQEENLSTSNNIQSELRPQMLNLIARPLF